MELGLREILSLAIALVTITGAAYVAKTQIKELAEKVFRHEKRLISLDHRQDNSDLERAVIGSKVETLAQINSVDNLEKHNREIAAIQTEMRIRCEQLSDELSHLRSMHNHKHPPVN